MSSHKTSEDLPSLADVDTEANNTNKDQPQLVHRLFTPLIPSKKRLPLVPSEEERNEFPAYKTNWISRLFLLWLLPLYNTGYLRTITQHDLWYLGDEFSLEATYPEFKQNFERNVINFKTKNPDALTLPPSVISSTLFRTFRFKYTVSIILKNIADCLLAFTPLVTRNLISFVQEKTADPSIHVGRGIGLAFGVALMLLVRSFVETQANLVSFHIGAQSRTLLTKMILEKSFVDNSETRHNFSNGVLFSFLSTDITRLGEAIAFFPELTAFLIPTIAAIVLLIINMKVSALAGIAVYFLVLILIVAPMQGILSLRDKANVHTDKRVELVREIVQSIKVIKFYSWENAYENIVKVVRAQEVNYVLKIQLLISIIVSLAMSASPIISMVAILVYHKVSDGRNPAVIFSSMTLFNILNLKMITLTTSLGSCTDGLNAARRLMKYFQSPVEPIDSIVNYFDPDLIKGFDNIAIKVEEAEFQWEKFDEEKKNKDIKGDGSATEEKKRGDSHIITEAKPLGYETVLNDVNLEITKGEFVIITGPIGSGKSSLLSGLSGLIRKNRGRVSINGSFLLCGAPWIQNTTIRDNILFGSPFEKERYSQVIEACCLEQDIAQFSAGDLTEIGERGVNLSGGQKARLCLARVIYADPDVILFDDVLSAVDANVGNRIVNNLLMGLIRSKTRVLATHQLSLITKADKIIFVNGDGSVEVGTYESLLDSNQKFTELLGFNKSREQKENITNDDELSEESIKKPFQEDENSNLLLSSGLYGEEERAVNSIPLSTYVNYINSGRGIFGSAIIPMILACIVLSIFCTMFANVWLTYWLENKFESLSQGTYIGMYICFTFAAVLFSSCEFGLESYVIVQASKILSFKAVSNVLHAPMWFFDTTPIGRVINRFSKDTNSLDNEIGDRLKICVHMVGLGIGDLILAIVYVPWFAIVIPFILGILIGCTNYYQATSREVKRLEAVNRSFILNNFNESISGCETIKLFQSQNRFIAKNNLFCDKLNEVYFVVLANQRWIGLSLDSLGVVVLFIVSMMIVTGVFDLSPSAAGLLIFYMSDFSGLVSNILNLYVDIENDMNSVERLMHYANHLAQEPTYRSSSLDRISPNWPEYADIKFQNVSLRYRHGLPLVLKHLSIDVKAGEKIGICGRTGAGKSSLMVALYRLAELDEGIITIDGVDISKIGLHDLRSRLSIIPQDPVLFQGTIRRNLDPFSERNDDELWDALRRSHLIKSEDLQDIRNETNIDNLSKFHLESQVLENGSNFSLGERQLISLARALVRQCKILIMDEATSSVDYETDHLIQETIATEFRNCTILCIAHRLKTIIGYDRILVLEQGELEEYDSPLRLFQKGGLFNEMCSSAGICDENFNLNNT